MGRSWLDRTGQTYGRLTVLRVAGKDARGRNRWLCRCSCAARTEVIVTGHVLQSGQTTSCGCWRAERCAAVGRSCSKREGLGAAAQPEALRALYEEELLSYKEIGERLGIDPRTVLKWLRADGVPVDDREKPRRRRRVSLTALGVTGEALRAMYEDEQLSLVEIGVRLGVSEATVRDRLQEAGVPIRTSRNGPMPPRFRRQQRLQRKITPEELRAMYEEEQLSSVAIGARLGVDARVVLDWLRADGVLIRSKAAAAAVRGGGTASIAYRREGAKMAHDQEG